MRGSTTEAPRLLWLTLALALAAPRAARAVEVGLELQPGVGFSLLPFPAGVPISVTDPQGQLVLHQPDSAYNLLVDLKPAPAFSFMATLLLGQFTVRAAVSVQGFSSERITDVAIRRLRGQDLPDPLPNVYLRNLAGLQLPSPQQVALPATPTLTELRLTLGYRFYLLEHRFRPYLPMGIGPVLALFDGSANYGLDLHTGLGAEYRVAEHVDLGLAVQYEWMGIVLPASFQPAAATQGVATQVSSGHSVLGAFLKSHHTLQLGVTTTIRF